MLHISTDIVIVGSGLSGYAAAMAASSEGCTVTVIDKSSIAGGNATNANVGTICGAYYRANAGLPTMVGYQFCREFYDKLLILHNQKNPLKYHNGLWIIPYKWAEMKTLLDSEFSRAGIICHQNARLTEVVVEDGKIVEMVVDQFGKISKFHASKVIDCSGNAIVSQLAGIKTISSPDHQAASQVFRIAGFTIDNEFSLDIALKRSVAKALTLFPELPKCLGAISVVPGSMRHNAADIKIVLPDTITDNEEQQNQIAQAAKLWPQRLIDIINKIGDSLNGIRIEKVYPSTGIRVLQRSLGEYILTESDVLSCKKTNDGIAIGTWPIEEWGSDGKLKMEYFAENDGYSISARCLQSAQLSNLLFAGKNISANTHAIGSARVIGTCLQTGFAAGKLSCCIGNNELIEQIQYLNSELNSV